MEERILRIRSCSIYRPYIAGMQFANQYFQLALRTNSHQYIEHRYTEHSLDLRSGVVYERVVTLAIRISIKVETKGKD